MLNKPLEVHVEPVVPLVVLVPPHNPQTSLEPLGYLMDGVLHLAFDLPEANGAVAAEQPYGIVDIKELLFIILIVSFRLLLLHSVRVVLGV